MTPCVPAKPTAQCANCLRRRDAVPTIRRTKAGRPIWDRLVIDASTLPAEGQCVMLAIPRAPAFAGREACA